MSKQLSKTFYDYGSHRGKFYNSLNRHHKENENSTMPTWSRGQSRTSFNDEGSVRQLQKQQRIVRESQQLLKSRISMLKVV